jgi:MFS family permease
MFTYFIALQFLDYITKKLGMIATVSFGLLIIIFGSLLVYPIKIFPQSLLLIILGLSLIGASGAPINVPVIMLLGHFIKINDNSIDEFTANDIASALYNLGINIGDFGGPIVGGFISDQFGFQFSCIFTSFLNLVLFIIYFGIYFNVILREIGVSNDDNNKKLIFDEEDINKEFNKNSSYSSFGSLKFVSQRKHTSFISIHRIESKENSIRKSYEDDFY